MTFHCSELSFFLNELFIMENVKHVKKEEKREGALMSPFSSFNTGQLVGLVSLSVDKGDQSDLK